MSVAQLILDLLVAAVQAFNRQTGKPEPKLDKILGLLQQGLDLASVAKSATIEVRDALQHLTLQIQAMSQEGRDDLTEEELSSLEAKIAAAHAAIQVA